jgi:transcriptional regulator with XRE-family HTH domain
MTDPERLLSEFIDAWSAGERPEADEYIERAPQDARDALADDIAAYLALAPTPDYSAGVLDELLRDRAVLELADAIESERGLWPALLPRLRRQAGLDRSQLAARLIARLGVEGGETKTERYLQQMERGRLDPRGVSHRVLDSLGRILGVGGDVLARAADFQLFSEPAVSGATLGGAVADRAGPAAGAEPFDEIDRLFRGGRDGGA